MAKLEIVNNKREIKKILDERFAKGECEEFLTFTWDTFSSLVVQIDGIAWKNYYIPDDGYDDATLYECYKATVELYEWAKARYGDIVKYPKSYFFEGQTEWLVYD